MPSFPKEVALAEEPAARQSVVGFLRNVNRKSTAVTWFRVLFSATTFGLLHALVVLPMLLCRLGGASEL